MVLKCLYCGNQSNNKEHLPSKSLLEKPYPTNLLTFPACNTCNNSFSLDEEYFLNVLATLSENGPLVERTEIGGSIYKSRLRSNKLYKRLLNSLVSGEDGRTYFKPETERLKRVIEKYAFGLYYFKYKKLVPLKLFKCTGFYPFQSEDTRPTEIIMLTHNERFKLKKWTHVQKNVFSYIIVRDWRRNNRLTMIFHIHNTVWCVVEIPYPSSNKWNKKNSEEQFSLF